MSTGLKCFVDSQGSSLSPNIFVGFENNLLFHDFASGAESLGHRTKIA